MNAPRVRDFVIAATMAFAFLIGWTFGVAARSPRTVASIATATVVKVKSLSAEERGIAKAARVRAVEKANDESWAAFGAARREPKRALKNISLTPSEQRATRYIGTQYVDRFEILDRDDKNARQSPPYTSTLIRDIGVLRLSQRADLRRALSRENRVRFDTNVMALVAKNATY